MGSAVFTQFQNYVAEYISVEYQEFFQVYYRSVLTVGAGIALWWIITRKPKGIPPGPRFTLPIVGDLLTLGDKRDDGDIRLSFRRLRKKYGDIYSLYMGPKLVIVLNGYDIIKEALVKNGDVFSERPELFTMDYITNKKGLVNAIGQNWKEQRKFAAETFRELGFGRSTLEHSILEEIDVLVAAIRQRNGQPFDLHRLLQASVSNVISCLVFGHRFDYKDPLFKRFLEIAEENMAAIGSTVVLNALPILRFLPGDLFKFKQTMNNINFIRDKFISPAIEEHFKNFDENDTNDYISCYIKEIKRMENCGQISNLNRENLRVTIGDLFMTGTETTTTSVRWTILYFLHYPEVHEKCFKEIQEVIGPGRQPSMKDKPSMPYNEAVTTEVLRIANLTAIGAPRATSGDIVFHGYTIPKEAMVIPNVDSVLSSDEVWGDADAFRPERFLDSNGKIVKKEENIPFGIGRRNCLGEAMAKMELFLFLTTLIQRFDFKPADPASLPPIKGSIGVTHSPLAYEVRIVPR